MMEHQHWVSRERELDVDLESGGMTSEEDRREDFISTNGQTKRVGFWRQLLAFDCMVDSSKSGGEVSDYSVELLIGKNSEAEDGQQQMASVGKKRMEEKRNKKNSTKPPKPPRPPKAPALDAADQKLVQEIAELATRKRARIERLKALRKMRAAKTSSWNSSAYAMVFTVLFLLVVIFQGICSRHSGSIFSLGSPAPAVAVTDDLISIQFYDNLRTWDSDGPGSGSRSLAEGQVSLSGLRKK